MGRALPPSRGFGLLCPLALDIKPAVARCPHTSAFLHFSDQAQGKQRKASIAFRAGAFLFHPEQQDTVSRHQLIVTEREARVI